jgi:hypothetical protein
VVRRENAVLRGLRNRANDKAKMKLQYVVMYPRRLTDLDVDKEKNNPRASNIKLRTASAGVGERQRRVV